MVIASNVILSLIAGIVLGTLFFGGLWLTVKIAVKSAYAALWVSASSLIRTIIALTGFYFVADGNWQKFLACLLGFVTARFIVMFLTKYYDQKQVQINKTDPS